MSDPNFTPFDQNVRDLIEKKLNVPLLERRMRIVTEDDPLEWLEGHEFPGQVELDETEDAWIVTLDALATFLPTESARDATIALQADLAPYGYQALTTSSDAGYLRVPDPPNSTQIVVFKAADAIPLLVVRQTNGINCDVYPQDLVEWLDRLSEQCEFSIIGAGHDYVDLQFSTLPADVQAFADDVYEFCPDTLEQGIAKAPPTGFDEMSLEDQVEWMDDALESQTTEDLAAALAESGRLFLWWD